MSEQWRAIPGYEGRYEVSDQGRVRSWLPYHHTPTPRILKPALTGDRANYLSVNLTGGGRRWKPKVHYLVLAAFVGPRPHGYQVRHLDGDPANNTVANLAWGTASENRWDTIRHGRHHELLKTHCPAGHPYDEQNTVIEGRRRRCRTCRSTQESAYRAARRLERVPA